MKNSVKKKIRCEGERTDLHGVLQNCYRQAKYFENGVNWCPAHAPSRIKARNKKGLDAKIASLELDMEDARAEMNRGRSNLRELDKQCKRLKEIRKKYHE